MVRGAQFQLELSFNDTVVPKMISDFDDDKLDDFIIRSGWGIGIIGNTNGQLVAKAATPYEFPIGTSVETQWILSPSDEVVAVGRFGRASSGAAGEMVLKGPSGFAFVGVQKDRGILEAMTVVPYGTRLEGGWWVGPDDKVIGVGRLNGSADCLVVISSWGMSVWAWA